MEKWGRSPEGHKLALFRYHCYMSLKRKIDYGQELKRFTRCRTNYYFGCCKSIQALYLGIFKELDRLYYLVLSLFLFIEAEIEGGERSSKNLSALSWVKCGGQLERNMRKSEKKVTTVFSEVRVRGQVSKDSAKFSRA